MGRMFIRLGCDNHLRRGKKIKVSDCGSTLWGLGKLVLMIKLGGGPKGLSLAVGGGSNFYLYFTSIDNLIIFTYNVIIYLVEIDPGRVKHVLPVHLLVLGLINRCVLGQLWVLLIFGFVSLSIKYTGIIIGF